MLSSWWLGRHQNCSVIISHHYSPSLRLLITCFAVLLTPVFLFTSFHCNFHIIARISSSLLSLSFEETRGSLLKLSTDCGTEMTEIGDACINMVSFASAFCRKICPASFHCQLLVTIFTQLDIFARLLPKKLTYSLFVVKYIYLHMHTAGFHNHHRI